MTEFPKKITDDPYGAAILIRRLITEQGAAYWRRYLLAFVLMGVSAGATAGSAYILGQVINQAYVEKNVRGIAILSGITVLLFMLKGASTYGHTVILSKISNAILSCAAGFASFLFSLGALLYVTELDLKVVADALGKRGKGFMNAPKDVGAVIERMCRLDPAGRYQKLEDVVDDAVECRDEGGWIEVLGRHTPSATSSDHPLATTSQRASRVTGGGLSDTGGGRYR